MLARACESRKPDGIITDPKSIEICDRIGFATGDCVSSEYQLAIAVRTAIVDRAMVTFLERNPGGTIVTLAAGLDTRPTRLDNGRARWVDVDLPAVIDLRSDFFPQHDRHRMISASVLDHRWMSEVHGDRPTMFLLEGLINYLEFSATQELVKALVLRFPSAELVMEALGLLYVRLSNRDIYKWGLCAENFPTRWEPRLELIDSWYVYGMYGERWREFPWLSLFVLFKRDAQVVLHLRAKG